MNLLERINDDSDDGRPVRTWRPDREDDCPHAIGGRVVRVGRVTFGDDSYERVELLDYDGETVWEVIARHAALARQLDEVDVGVGDELAVKFLGSGSTKEGRFVFRYKVLVDRPRGEQPPLPGEELRGAMAEDIEANLARLRPRLVSDLDEEPF